MAKAKPGQYNYASAGNGSASHLAMAYFDSLAGIDLVHIPTKGTGDAITELLAGRAQAVIAANVAALPFANDSRIRFWAFLLKSLHHLFRAFHPLGIRSRVMPLTAGLAYWPQQARLRKLLIKFRQR